MTMLTDKQLQQVAALHGVVQRRNVVVSGGLRRCLTEKQRFFFHRFRWKTFAVLDGASLVCYESETDWRRSCTPARQIRLTSIRSIESTPTSIAIGYLSDRHDRLLTMTLACEDADRMRMWRTLLKASLPGDRAIQNFAPALRLPGDASVHQIVDCIATAFPTRSGKSGGGCFQPGCTMRPAPHTKYCAFHRRIHADRQFRLQIGDIRRLIQDCRMDLERAIVDVAANTQHDDALRRRALQLLWDVCSYGADSDWDCETGSGNEPAAVKFLNHMALLSQCQTPDLIISDGVLDVLLQRTPTDRGECRVERPSAWPALFALLATAAPDNRQRILHTINFLLIDNTFNCGTLSTQTRWQSYLYAAMITSRAGLDMIVALSLNIFVIMSFDALINADRFASTVNDCLVKIQQSGALDPTSLMISRAYLIALSNKIVIASKLFPIDIGTRPWIQSMLFGNIVLRFLFRTADWGQIKPTHRRSSLKTASITTAAVTYRFRHAKHFYSSGSAIGKFPIETRLGRHRQDDLDGDVILAEKMVAMYETLLEVVRDPNTMMDANRDPYVIRDAELLIERFRQAAESLVSARADDATDRRLEFVGKRPLYLYH